MQISLNFSYDDSLSLNLYIHIYKIPSSSLTGFDIYVDQCERINFIQIRY